MELRHLRYFLAAAEELNFTRAARRLNIAQPPLTQQIKALESELGVELFDRSAYRIALSEPGKIFLEEVRQILGRVSEAVQRARLAGRGQLGRLRIGFTESASFNPLVPAAFQSFRAATPDVELALEEHHSTELAAALREGRLDAAFLRPPLMESDDSLALHPLASEAMVVALPATHRLADRANVALAELAVETFILYPRAIRPGLADAVITACERAGFSPRIGQHTPQLSSTINLVAASLGVSVVPECMRQLRPQGVRYLPIRGDALTAMLGIAHRAAERSPTVLNFIAIAKEVAGRSGAFAVDRF